MAADAPACPQPRFNEAMGSVVGADRECQVLDLFRHIAAFRASYDAALLDKAAAYAARLVGGSAADDLMAAAIRLDNEMRCQTSVDYAPLPPGCLDRHECEEIFLGMMRALCNNAERAALGFAGRLGIIETRTLFGSAREVAALAGWQAAEPAREATIRAPRRAWQQAGLAYGQA